MMKKLLILFLVLVLPLAACNKQESKESTLTVGGRGFSGDFINGFGGYYDVADSWVRTILYSHYSTYVTTDVGEIVLNNTVVKNREINTDAAGNKTYTFEIYDDLKWSNGDAITAQDFVCTVLWSASLEWADVGATSTIGEGLLGYADYHAGSADRFAGVQLIDQYKYSLTIDAAQPPDFFETKYVALYPLCLATWSGAKIISGPEGARLDSDSPDWTLAFDTMRVAQTERFTPTVTSGPFTFVSCENNAVTMEANPYFKGDYKGQKLQIDTLIIRYIQEVTNIEQCIQGQVSAVTGIIEGFKIEQAQNSDALNTSYYQRNGFSGLMFHCDFGPTQHQEVRQAIAHLLDRQALIDYYLDGYGSIVNGACSQAQWQYIENKATVETLPAFTQDIARANKLLQQSPYKYEADGKTPFNPAKAVLDSGYYRHNNQGERLTIHYLDTLDGNVGDPLTEQLLENAPLAGLDWQIAESDFANLLKHYYEGHTLGDQRKYHAFPLATSFEATYDPYYEYHSDLQYTLYNNIVHLSDPELDEIMVRMRQFNPGQKAQYSAEWVKFQTRWNELLPAFPLYVNQYFDVYGKEIQGFRNTTFTSWADLICEISSTK